MKKRRQNVRVKNIYGFITFIIIQLSFIASNRLQKFNPAVDGGKFPCFDIFFATTRLAFILTRLSRHSKDSVLSQFPSRFRDDENPY